MLSSLKAKILFYMSWNENREHTLCINYGSSINTISCVWILFSSVKIKNPVYFQMNTQTETHYLNDTIEIMLSKAGGKTGK